MFWVMSMLYIGFLQSPKEAWRHLSLREITENFLQMVSSNWRTRSRSYLMLNHNCQPEPSLPLSIASTHTLNRTHTMQRTHRDQQDTGPDLEGPMGSRKREAWQTTSTPYPVLQQTLTKHHLPGKWLILSIGWVNLRVCHLPMLSGMQGRQLWLQRHDHLLPMPGAGSVGPDMDCVWTRRCPWGSDQCAGKDRRSEKAVLSTTSPGWTQWGMECHRGWKGCLGGILNCWVM